MKKIISILFSVAVSFSVFGQEITDSAAPKASKKYSVFGFRSSILYSKQFTTTFSEYGKTISNFSSKYFLTPSMSLSFFLKTEFNKFYIENELLYSSIKTYQTFIAYQYTSNPNWNGYATYKQHYYDLLLSYKLQGGIHWKNFNAKSGLQFSHVFSSELRQNIPDFLGNTVFTTNMQGEGMFAITMDFSYILRDRYEFGIGYYRQLLNNVEMSVSKKFHINSICFGLAIHLRKRNY